ncbi:MAG: hypothetical protein EBY24_21000, partial [Betaproteobacteria bacterium]|nr:hypothetical protein [Betaproteobacteria bacterium]
MISTQPTTSNATKARRLAVVPGARAPAGHSIQLGFGIHDNLELVGRLATQDLKCNMFRANACPPNTVRDFSASMKWSLPIDWLRQHDASVAVGASDMGGAAAMFKSYYAVGSKSFGALNLSLGTAHAVGDSAVLRGPFGALSWQPTPWSKLSVEKIGDGAWGHAGLNAPVPGTDLSAWISLSRNLNDSPLTPKQWAGFGFSLPLDKADTQSRLGAGASASSTPTTSVRRLVRAFDPKDLSAELEKNGFFNPRIGSASSGKLVLELENTAYQWNILDAAGVALGVLTGAYGGSDKDFELVLTTRGVKQLLVQGNAACVKRWLEAAMACDRLKIQSLNTRVSGHDYADVVWMDNALWNFRPEIVISPTLTSTIGTEFGAFDMDLGLNVNTILPLWKGAWWDVNRIHPVGISTRNFEQGGVFYASRLKQVTSRDPAINTQARLSVGTAYNVWEGKQIDTSTQSDDGRHRLGILTGDFRTDTLKYNNAKSYQLLSYRYAYNDAQTTTTEITQGKFWGGDTGFSVSQKFWHGDTAFTAYIRRTRMNEFQPIVSFAGLQFSIPFTPQRNKGLEHAALRGVNQWTYTVETKILETNNQLTGGFGELPKTGDTLAQTLNRDR